MADAAAFTAAVAADTNPTPRILRVASDVLSWRELAAAATRADSSSPSAKPFSLSWMGSVWFLELAIPLVRRAMGGEDQQMPAWQGMQYMANMASGLGKLEPLDNDRYPELQWTKAEDFLRKQYKSEAAK
ncbi:hypothetical protein Micbo1qcDRAFT_210509 [Microdochium bolleyi]|uniref:NmrA-like domain-containing protein n=1 Tax=Microdochium bolleyi TaxID=196109 RepID=A0A136IID6_9PEZI|nr:hypothetical protein Micbo1qcDRAFT_210509 [Microdochium bolleyi]